MKRAFRKRKAGEYVESIQEREARFAVLDRIKQKLPDVPPEEVERDVQAAVRAVRGRRA